MSTLEGGTYLNPPLPYVNFPAGVSMPWGTMLPPGGKVVAYVRSGGRVDGDPPDIADRLVSSLAQALPYAREGRGDIIVCLPGHAENVDSATFLANLKPGTKVVGAGDVRSSNAPTFTWTTTAAQWNIDDADCTFQNLKLDLTGIDAVAEAIAISATGCTVAGCLIDMADASAQAVTGIRVAGTGTFASILGNYITGTPGQEVTNPILVQGVPLPSNAVIAGNMCNVASAVGNGVVNVASGATNLLIANNIIHNTATASEEGIVIGAVAAQGVISRNLIGVLANAAANAAGIELGAGSLMRCFENYVSDENLSSGVLSPVAAT